MARRRSASGFLLHWRASPALAGDVDAGISVHSGLPLEVRGNGTNDMDVDATPCAPGVWESQAYTPATNLEGAGAESLDMLF
eukprot:3613128-Karenia_brevis.AAC.1